MESLKVSSRFLLFALMAITSCLATLAQEQSTIVVVMNNDYTYSDPRWNQNVTLEKGFAITVYDIEGDDYEYWPYPAADVAIPKSVAHIPGTLKSERCLVVNTSNVHFLEKPSANSRVLCDNIESTASVYHTQFINMSKKPKKDDFGLAATWDPFTVKRNTAIPYKGKTGNFYKTEINGYTLYIPTKQARLK